MNKAFSIEQRKANRAAIHGISRQTFDPKYSGAKLSAEGEVCGQLVKIESRTQFVGRGAQRTDRRMYWYYIDGVKTKTQDFFEHFGIWNNA